ncbi:hypothetical protein GCM10009733_107570 [Nonomuraea maheshkhaliensis]|uniref:Uncharacterized protein n=1 Tax=Nonomuraea maheshkhaliensis TaxID=419590 RepID=A0ABP4TUS2_9ACTN
MAVYVIGPTPKIALYDLESELITATYPLPASGRKVRRDSTENKLTEADTAVELVWTGDATLRMVRKIGFKRVRVQVYGIDVATGSVRPERAYAITGTTEEALSGR